jgi:serine/threonine protein kinase
LFRVKEGETVGERYVLEKQLGEGGMGEVWAATHLITRKSVAVKFLKFPKGANEGELIARFVREARAASAVRHPNVVEIHDVLTLPNGSPMMVMDLLRGETLTGRLERDRQLDIIEAGLIMAPVISAVIAAHAVGIVHRDLKPDNIFLAQLGDGRIEPKVLDFGIAKLSAVDGDAASTSKLTRTGSMLGTPYYMSPEQIYGEKDVDARADVWALGVILYEILTGHRPFEGENFGQLLKAVTQGTPVPLQMRAPQLPREVIEIVSGMLVVNRQQRLSNLADVHACLRAFCGDRVSLLVTGSNSLAGQLSGRPSGQVSGQISGHISGQRMGPVTGAPLAASAPGVPQKGSRPAVFVVAGAIVLAIAGGAVSFLHGGGSIGHVTPPPPPPTSQPATTTAPASLAPDRYTGHAHRPDASAAPASRTGRRRHGRSLLSAGARGSPSDDGAGVVARELLVRRTVGAAAPARREIAAGERLPIKG